jgi:hypothetical protein
MQEDSGAFKTNPANSRQIPAFCNDPGAPLHRSLTGQRSVSGMRPGHSFRPFVTNTVDTLRYSQTSLIRCALAVSDASRTRQVL